MIYRFLSFVMLAVFLSGVLCGLTPLCGASTEQGGESRLRWREGGLVFALRPDKNPDAMLEEREALGAKLSGLLGVPARVVVPLSAAVVTEGLSNGSIDAAYVSATEMSHIADASAGRMLLANLLDGKPGYESLWLVRKEDPARTIEDLRGQPVAFSSRTSTSGFLIPLRDLVQRGLVKDASELDKFFGDVIFGTGYVSAVERVLEGQARAAAVSDYVFYGSKHLSEEQKGRLRVLQTQGPVPTHVIAVSCRLGAEQADLLQEVLLRFNEPELVFLRDRVFTGPLAVLDQEEHLRPVREARVLAEKGH